MKSIRMILLTVCLSSFINYAQVIPTNEWVSFYSGQSTLNNLPLPVGTLIEAYDPDGVLCGSFTVHTNGHYGFLQVYRDDPTTPGIDEGAEPGDTITFKINGQNAFPLGPSTPIWSYNGEVKQLNLEATIELQFFQLTVSVENSWNMVSIPGLHPTDQNVNTWWSGKDPLAGVFRFTTGYNPVTEVTPGIGYWMKHIGANTYNTGDEWPAGGIQIVPNVPLTGLTGWNLIGGYHLTVATSGITTTPGGLQSGSVFGYTPGTGYAPAANLVPGYGYWIKLTAGGQINIPSSLAKSSPVTEYIKSDWGRIILTDAAGKSYTLYSVNGEVDLNQYELPPLPPAGMFDVRYGSQRMAEQIGSEIQTIEMSGIEYPVTVRVEGITIRVQDETGKIVNAVLKSGEDVVISNPMVEKLKVSGNTIPETYSLEQNYPNPFNPSTKIKFAIAKETDVNLIIYNTLGERVTELKNERLVPGYYEVVFNASALASGVYFYRIQAGDFMESKKMLLLK